VHYKIFHDDDDDDDDVYRHVGLRRSSMCMLARLGKTCQSIEFQFLTIGVVLSYPQIIKSHYI